MLRAERLANPVFFNQRQVCSDKVFALLAAGQEDTHGVLFDSGNNTLYCSCPYFPKPCVHARALALLVERDGLSGFEPVAALPRWAQNLLDGQPAHPDKTAGTEKQREAARANRHLERLERAERGFEDLEMWLTDTLRRGVATSVSEDPAFYQTIAARLADASMRSLSRTLRLLDTIPAEAPDWTGRTLAVLADAALALHAFRKREQLPETLINDLESFIGIVQKKETVLAQGEVLHDTWAVAGAIEETVEEPLRVRRTWLLGARSNRFALLLDYAHGEVEFPPGYAPGTLLEGALIFYPSSWPQRALIRESLNIIPKKVEKLPGFSQTDEMLHAYATALGVQPWLTHFPAVLSSVIPYHENGRFGLADAGGKSLPIAHPDSSGWPLVAVGGGRPLIVFGEWDGALFHVLSAVESGRLAIFSKERLYP